MRPIIAATIALILVSSALTAQTKIPHQDTKINFTGPGGTFRFEYPAMLMPCKRDPDQPGRWMPDQPCAAAIPVCSDVFGNSDDTIACVAYPSDKIDTSNARAAAFSVNRLEKVTTSRECHQVSEPPPHVGSTHIKKINGADYRVTEVYGLAAGNVINGSVYRTFHANQCYELDIRIAYSNPEQIGPGVAKNPSLEVMRRCLAQVLETFKFLR